MSGITQTVRYALRQLGRSPGFTVTAILTLALGIGANVAVFSVMNAVMLNPSGIPHPDRIVALRANYSVGVLNNISMSATDFGDAISEGTPLAAGAVMNSANYNYLAGDSSPVRLIGAQVSWHWFDVFQATPMMGRTFRPEEDLPNANHELVLSYRSWKNRFGADPNIVGRKLNLNEQSYEVIGVMGPEFGWPNQAELWVPLGLPSGAYTDPKNRYNEYLFAVGRLRDGATVQAVNVFLKRKAQVSVLAEGTASYGKASGWGMFSMPLNDFVSGNLSKPLSILLGAVLLILLIVCANIAGLQLARATARQREVAIQIALGASRARLIRHALVESLILAAAGVGLGLLLAKVAIPALMLLAPVNVGANIQVPMGMDVLLFAVAVGVLCAVLCGTAPAWHMTHVRWFQSLQESGRSETSSRSRQRLRSALVIAEIATAMLLLVGAGLLVRSLEQVERVETGLDSRGVMTALLSLPPDKYKSNESKEAFFSALETQLRAQPGVEDVAMSDSLPFVALGGSSSFIILGRPVAANDPGPHGNIRSISPGYFSTLRIPVLRGRVFTDGDRATTEQVAVIDDVLARQYWPNQDPVGQHIAFGLKTPPITIVGLVKHARDNSLEADGTEGYYLLPLAQQPVRDFSFAVRTSAANPESIADAMKAAARGVDPNQPMYDLKSMDERIDASLSGRKFLVVLLSLFAGLALLLAALGLYGVITYGVKLRMRELGIRLALGAQRSDVLRLVLGQGLRLAAAGLALGLASVIAANRILASLLFQVSWFNPLTLLATSLMLAVTVVFASYLPAQRASKVDPMETLRQE